jgi:KDO2-lipid IV(A) lauroyltransferase
MASNFGGFIGSFLGQIFRSKKLIKNNIKKSLPKISENEMEKIIKAMWSNYGRILSDYVFIKNFRQSKLEKYLEIEGKEIFEEIKKNGEPVVFISGHFNNFELMAMEIEKSGVSVAAIYRPLNNIFLNKIMESIRKKYICKHQIKKGISGIREILQFCKKGFSIALMIDQRVSEGIKSNLFGQPALTTTIPAQLVKKFGYKIVPIYIERINKLNYKMKINRPIKFDKNETIESITNQLNNWLEKMISIKPNQWIWSHNRWK